MTVSLSEWPNEAQAAAALGISEKTIVRYANAGKIETRKRPRPGKKPENVYNPHDLERLLPAAHVMPAEAQKGTAIARLPTAPAKTLDPAPVLAMIRAIATAIETERKIIQMPKLWLSLEEAAAYSGLSVSCVRGSIVAPEHYQPGENLIGIRAGRHGSWRIQRASLEAFAG